MILEAFLDLTVLPRAPFKLIFEWKNFPSILTMIDINQVLLNHHNNKMNI